MARLTFNTPFMLGFENLERMMDQVTKAGSEGGFPPYNIEQIDSETLRITLAVAGYDEKDLDVSVEDTQLIIRGRQSPDQETRQYIYRGIAGRTFQRSFVLAQGMKVKTAFMDKGLLHIDLEKPNPQQIVTKIKITSCAPKKTLLQTKDDHD